VTYFSKNGTAIKGKKPPKTIPIAALFKLGSANAAIKSAMMCANTIPTIPAIAPFDTIFKNRYK